jgi:hypothetical protein
MTFEILLVCSVVSSVIAILLRNYVLINANKPAWRSGSVGATGPKIQKFLRFRSCTIVMICRKSINSHSLAA